MADSTNVPYGYCHCGCGRKTRIAPRTNVSKGWTRGQPLKYLRGHFGLRHDLAPPNPSGLCMCGCGEKTLIAEQSSATEGWIKGEPIRYINGHNKRSELSEEERFWAYVDASGACWEWTGYRDKDGYGRFTFASLSPVPQGAHRIAYQLTKGPIPDDLLVMHSCDNPPCCNPDHLTPGTDLQNQRDRRGKGR